MEDVRIPRDLRKWSAGVWFSGVWGDLDMTLYWEHSVSPQRCGSCHSRHSTVTPTLDTKNVFLLYDNPPPVFFRDYCAYNVHPTPFLCACIP